MQTSDNSESSPPLSPVIDTVFMPISFAVCAALAIFPELPDVLRARRRSFLHFDE